MKITKSKLKEIIREELLNEKSLDKDFKFDNIRISVYEELEELTIRSAPGSNIDLTFKQLPTLIKILKKIK